MKIILRQAARWIAEREVVWVFVAAPWLLMPDGSPWLTTAALVVVASLWLFRVLAGQPIHVPTPLNLPLSLLLLSLGIAVLAEPFTDWTTSSATTIVLGVALVCAISNGSDRWRGIQSWGALLTASGSVFAIVSLALTDFPQGKVSMLAGLETRIRALSGSLRPATMAGLDPSQVGGVLVILVPIALGFAVNALQRGRQPLMSHWQVYAAAAFLATSAMLFALVLTQSRSALLVLVLVGVVVLGFRSRPIGVLVVALFITTGMLLLIGVFSGRLDAWMIYLDGLGQPPGADLTAWPQRVELWRSALLSVRDYPLTGVGLGAFVPVASVNYPLTAVTPDWIGAGVPNLWLQAGAELGLLGLVAFTWLTAIVVLMGWKIRLRRNGERTLLAGFWFGLIAWMAHGALAGVRLAEPFGILVWIAVGILLSGWQTGDELARRLPVRRGLAQAGWATGGLLLAGALGWLVLSPVLSLNKGAHLLDIVLVDASLGGLERASMLTEADSLFDQSGDLPGVARRRALVEYELGNDAQAVTAFRKDSDGEVFLISRSRWLLAEARLDEAHRLLEVAIASFPESPALACLSGEVSVARGDLFAALAGYRRGLELDSTDGGLTKVQAAVCHEGFAILAESLGWWDEVTVSLSSAVELQPDNLGYRLRYGWALYLASGEIGEPVAIEEAALRSQPDSVPTMLALIDIYLKANRPQKALDWSQTAVDTDSMDPGGWLRLAMSYDALEESDRAQSALAEALRLDPGNPEALKLHAEWQTP